jgi:hypothetical protein
MPLSDKYYEPASAGSYGGRAKLQRAAPDSSSGDVKKFLRQSDTYTAFYKRRKRFKRRRVMMYHRFDLMQSDLIDLGSLAKWNDGYRWILCVIDCFSKMLYCAPLKRKTGQEVTEAFDKLTGDLPPIKLLQTDDGKEYFNREFRELMKRRGIRHYSTKSDTKAQICERVQRTIQQRLFRYMYRNKTWRYVPVLEQVVDAYNRTHHSSIRRRPIEVTADNESEVFNALYRRKKQEPKPFKFNVGDRVRLSRDMPTFSKGYMQSFGQEVFEIAECHSGPETNYYRIRDGKGDIVEGSFYWPELVRFDKQGDEYLVESVLTSRTARDGSLEYLIKWIDHPKEFNSWEPERNVFQLRPPDEEEDEL